MLLCNIVQSKGGREVSGMRRMRSSGSYSVDEAFERLAKEADKGECWSRLFLFFFFRFLLTWKKSYARFVIERVRTTNNDKSSSLSSFSFFNFYLAHFQFLIILIFETRRPSRNKCVHTVLVDKCIIWLLRESVETYCIINLT